MIVAVDTGGTKTLISSFNAKGEIQSSFRFPTPKDKNVYVTTLVSLLQEQFGNIRVEALIIALPGIVKNGVAIWCDNLGWKDFDALEAFGNVLTDTPVYIENDANLAGLAEARVLDPIPTSVLYVTISTGIGTGIITNGKIDPGLRLSEGGHAMVEFEGKLRIWEDFASGKAIREVYDSYARDITSSKIWREIADRISRGFLVLIPIIQPDIIIIGGSMGAYFSKYNTQLESMLREKLPPHISCPRFIEAFHPEEAVVYGGYYYAIDILNS